MMTEEKNKGFAICLENFEDIASKEIKELISEFSELLPTSYKVSMTLLASFPQTTALACHTISKIVRSLKLRRQAVRPPRKRIKN